MLRVASILLLASTVVLVQVLPDFEPIQPELLGAGATFTNAFADYDNDGDPDMFVGFDGKPNRLYRNDKGVFADVAAGAGVADTPTKGASVLKLYRNTGGKFADATTESGLTVPAGAVRQPAWIDVDADGDLD